MKKTNLSKELKKYQLLVEYNFYVPKSVDEQKTPEQTPGQDMEDIPPPSEPTNTNTVPPEANGKMGVDPSTDIPTDTATPETTDSSSELSNLADANPPQEQSTENEGDVTVDITDLVSSTNDTKNKIEGTNELLNNLMSKFTELEGKISSFDRIVNKIDSLEKDFEKRLPTPVEKLELRSKDSYPYNLKLTDVFKNYLDGSEDDKTQTQDYTLTQDDVTKDYNALDIKSSFSNDEYLTDQNHT